MTVACQKNYSIKITACDASADWITDPGNCRLRIANFNDADWAPSVGCFDARLGVAFPWDGTYSDLVWVVFPQASWTYNINLALFQTAGGVYLGSATTSSIVYNSFVPRWRLTISYMTNALADAGRWTGDLAGTSPIGIYTTVARCSGLLPGTVEVEGYSL